MPCTVDLYCGPRREKEPRWVPAIIKKASGTRCFTVKIIPRGPVWRRHWEQLRPRYASDEDKEPGETFNFPDLPIDHPMEINLQSAQRQLEASLHTVPTSEYGPNNLRRSTRKRKQTIRYCCD